MGILQVFKNVGVWFSADHGGGARLLVGLHDLRQLFQPEQFHGCTDMFALVGDQQVIGVVWLEHTALVRVHSAACNKSLAVVRVLSLAVAAERPGCAPRPCLAPALGPAAWECWGHSEGQLRVHLLLREGNCKS